jgi:hypothetical protein
MAKVKTAFTVLPMVALLGMAACSDDDGNDGGATNGAEETEAGATERGKPILIKTHLAPLNARGEQTGKVLAGSTIGDSAFCAGGRFADAAEAPPLDESVSRTFHCPGGTLAITFSPTGTDLKQSGPWKVVKGLVGFDGLSGGGRMRVVFEPGDEGGRESFTGTVTR